MLSLFAVRKKFHMLAIHTYTRANSRIQPFHTAAASDVYSAGEKHKDTLRKSDNFIFYILSQTLMFNMEVRFYQ